MIIVKTKSEIEVMAAAGKIAGSALKLGGASLIEGITTKELDDIINQYILSENAIPSFLGYGGFPGSACISINEVVIHGIPGERVIKNGDIISIDVGATLDGFVGDCAATFVCGSTTPEIQALLDTTQECLSKAIQQAVVGNRIGDISNAVETLALGSGYGIIRDYVGHGVGRNMHEDPQVPNYGPAGRGPRLIEGMTIAIEPMIAMGSHAVKVLDDEWTVVTIDSSICAHFEHTIAITAGGPRILTLP